MRCALVSETGLVVNIVMFADPGPEAWPDDSGNPCSAVETPDGEPVGIGWTWTKGAGFAPPSAPAIEEAKTLEERLLAFERESTESAAKLAALRDEFDAKKAEAAIL